MHWFIGAGPTLDNRHDHNSRMCILLACLISDLGYKLTELVISERKSASVVEKSQGSPIASVGRVNDNFE